MAKEGKSAVVPRLRFPEFRETTGWDVLPMGRLLSLEYGASLPEHSRRPGPIPVMGSNGMVGYHDEASVKGPAIVIGRKGSVGEVNWIDTDCCPIDTTYYVDNKQPSSSSMQFLYHLLQCSKLNQRGDPGAVPGLNRSAVHSLQTAIPKPLEQQKIADCLTSLDELIAAQRRKVEALKTYKRGLMQQLFPREGETLPRLRFPEFRDAPEWESTTIQDLIDRKFIVGHLDGNHGELYPRADEFSTTGIPYITANDFRIGHVEFDTCKRISLERAIKFRKGVARDGDILFAHNATVGPVAKLVTAYDFVILSTTATYFRCDQKRLVNDFLLSALASPSFIAQYTRVMSQSTRDQVPITTQRKLFLQIPNSPEQYRVADCLSALDGLVAAAFARLDGLKAHKKGLIQQLFPSLEEA